MHSVPVRIAEQVQQSFVFDLHTSRGCQTSASHCQRRTADKTDTYVYRFAGLGLQRATCGRMWAQTIRMGAP